ncbi:MAG: hypothetical protein GC168_05240 [Candidatus Hydrogenedens sp.]|nr:hypothetical protein [Candidatus Hydrogenedens sp.]
MSPFSSTRDFDEFLNESRSRKYEKYRSDVNARRTFQWLVDRVESLLSSIRNHRRPALQGVIVDLEDWMTLELNWRKESQDNFFVTMIGAMVRYIVEEHGHTVKRTGVPLRHNNIITTAALYD